MSLAPLPRSYCRIEYADMSSDNNIADEAMQEVDLSSWGYARYTVFRITNPAKRCLHDNADPVFQADTGGNGVFETIIPSEVWWPAGYIVLDTPRGESDVVRCHSGHYVTPQYLFGCVTMTYEDKTIMEEKTCYGDTAIKRHPKSDDWTSRLEVFFAALQAELLTTGGNVDSHVHLLHDAGGTAGNAYSLEMTNPGGNGSISVALNNTEIVVTLARSSGVITSTAKDVINAINACTQIRAAHIHAELPADENGSGIVAALEKTFFSGGLDPIDFSSMKGETVIMRYYNNYCTGLMHVGYGVFEQLEWAGKPTDLLKCGISISGARHRLYQVVE